MKDNKAMKYITLITGVLTLLLGIYTLVRPMRTFLSIGWILGILLFVNGIELSYIHFGYIQILFCTPADFLFCFFSGLFIFCADRNIHLKFRLCTGRTNHNGAVVFQQKFQYIGFWKAIKTCCIVQKFKHLLITKFLNITTKRLHDLLHFDKSGTAIKFITVQGIQTVSIHPVQFVQFIQKTNAF